MSVLAIYSKFFWSNFENYIYKLDYWFLLDIYSQVFFVWLNKILNINLAINQKNLILLLFFNNNLLIFKYYCKGKILLKKARYIEIL